MLKTLKNKRIKIFKTNKNFRIFFIFFLISTIFWLLIKLSKEYTSDVSFKVTYKNIPTSKILQNKPVNKIRAIVKTHGFNLLAYHILDYNLNLDLESSKKRSEGIYYYLPNDNIIYLQSQLSSETEIVRIFPDTVILKYGDNKTKKVIIKPNISLSYSKGFNLIGNPIIKPNFIKVTGPEILIKKLDTINTVAFKKQNISSDINEDIALKLPLNKKIHFSSNRVKLTVKVVKFTENSINVPIEVINIPKNVKVNIFPKFVKITYKVSLSNFNAVKYDSFKVICNFKKALKEGLNYLNPELKKSPKTVSDIRISPKQIEYLVKK